MNYSLDEQGKTSYNATSVCVSAAIGMIQRDLLYPFFLKCQQTPAYKTPPQFSDSNTIICRCRALQFLSHTRKPKQQHILAGHQLSSQYSRRYIVYIIRIEHFTHNRIKLLQAFLQRSDPFKTIISLTADMEIRLNTYAMQYKRDSAGVPLRVVNGSLLMQTARCAP